MTSDIRLWCNFTVESEYGDLKLRIQDVPSDRLNDVVNLFVKYFVPQETFHKVAGIAENQDAVQECKEFVTEMINDKNSAVVICCKDDDPETVGEIIAASIMTLEKKDEPEDFDVKAKTKEMNRMFELMGSVFEKYDALKQLNLDSLYDDRGVVVNSDYRGLGIAQKLFHFRRVICKAEGVPMTGAWMTSFGSQKAAERDGWETAFEVPYEEISKQFGVTFKDVPNSCKYMIGRALCIDNSLVSLT